MHRRAASESAFSALAAAASKAGRPLLFKISTTFSSEAPSQVAGLGIVLLSY